MDNATVIRRIESVGIIPVIILENTEHAEKLGAALVSGGIPIAEVTFRTAGAERVISRMQSACPDLLVGAGTVLTPAQVDSAVEAGARFIVSPGLNRAVVERCQERGVLVIPGVGTASELDAAHGRGLRVVKFFPAEQNGGLAAIKALSGPYKTMRFVPTGGLGPHNLGEYLSFPGVLACGGTFMLGDGIPREDWEGIASRCRQTVKASLGLELAHVGLNGTSAEEALQIAERLGDLLCLPVKPGNSSNFVDDAIEVMKAPGPGARGHIGFRTASTDRAVRYFESQGIAFREDFKKYNAQGELTAVYFEAEIGGFALHLAQK